MKYPKHTQEVAMATSRSGGAVGPNAVVPKIMRELMGNWASILDYGCGRDALHVEEMRRLGWESVEPHDFHRPHKLVQAGAQAVFDGVYLSNVLNTMPDRQSVWQAIDESLALMQPNGIWLANYPASPRKSDVKPGEILEHLKREVGAWSVHYVKHDAGMPFDVVANPRWAPAVPVFLVSREAFYD